MGYQLKKFLFVGLLSVGCFFCEEQRADDPVKNATQSVMCSQTEEGQIRDAIQKMYKRLTEEHCPELSKANYPVICDSMQQMAQRAGVKMPPVFIIPRNSIYAAILRAEFQVSVTCNAMALGIDKQVQFILMDEEILKVCNAPEIVGINAHELSHFLCQHAQKKLKIFGIGATVAIAAGALFRTLDFLPASLPAQQRLRIVFYGISAYLGVLFADLAVLMWFSRHCERQADRRATQLVHNKKWINGLYKIDMMYTHRYPFTARMSKMLWPLTRLFATHPTFEQRKKAVLSEPCYCTNG